MERSPLHQQVDTLPDLVRDTIGPFALAVRALFSQSLVAGNPDSPLAQVADHVLATAVPPLRDEAAGLIVPGARVPFANASHRCSRACRARFLPLIVPSFKDSDSAGSP